MAPSTDKLALLGGKPIGLPTAPKFPVFTRTAINRVVKVLEGGQMVGLDNRHPAISAAEDAISSYHDSRHALAVSSGHAALHMALMGVDVGPGDEVITTPYTWGASVSCILHQSAIPVFADVDRLTGLMDPASIEACITQRTRAILVVHLYGQPANMTAICKIAKKHGLAVIEDGSQAHGARWKNKSVGNWGDVAGFSCMGGKILATGEGGYLVTGDPDIRWRACLSTQHMGRSPEPGFPPEYLPTVDSLLYTYRISTVMAVLMAEQFKKLDKELAVRRANVGHLRSCLDESQFIELPKYGKQALPSWHMLTANFRADEAGITRDTFVRALRAEGLSWGPYVPAPIPNWPRLQWRGYKGPKTMWMENLKRAKTDYSKTQIPNCRYKCDRSMEMSTNNFIRPARKDMERLASIVHKVERNVDALREMEAK